MPDLRLDWVQSPDDPTLAGDVVSYEVARSSGPNPTAVVATIPATVDAGDTLWTDNLVPLGTWYYRVRALDGAGRRSLWSDQAAVTVTPQSSDVRWRIVMNAVIQRRIVMDAVIQRRVVMAGD